MNMDRHNQSDTSRPTRFRRRRVRALALTALAIAVVWLGVALQEGSLWHSGYSTGWFLLGCLVFLTGYNIRKMIPFLSILGTSRWWMQLHIYVALFSIAVFGFHIRWQVPGGVFEQFLAALYVVVASSGVYGLFITRVVPRRLTATGHEVIFEQIPVHRHRLVQRARSLILETVETTDVLSGYYVKRLAFFLERPRSLAYNIVPSRRHSAALVEEMQQLDRYLTIPQRETSRHLAGLVREKENLDYHWALQGRLKTWLFLHIGLTYGLLTCSILHGVLVHAFGGGLR